MPWDVIVNARARQLGDGTPLRRAIDAATGGATVHVTRSLGELDAVATAIAERGTGAVVLAGGDGTTMAGVSALASAFARAPSKALPSIALAPGGTVGTIARAFGARDGAAYVGALLAAVGAGAATETARRSLHVEDDLGPPRVGFIFGAGLVASFFEVYDAEPDRGTLTAARLVARIFAGSFLGGRLARRVLEPVACELSVDGVAAPPRAWSLVATSVLDDLGLGMRLTYRAGERADRLHVVASPLSPARLGPQMPRVLAGRALSGEHHVDALARELALRFTGERGAYVLDGDTFAARAVRVTPGPTLRLLTPPRR